MTEDMKAEMERLAKEKNPLYESYKHQWDAPFKTGFTAAVDLMEKRDLDWVAAGKLAAEAGLQKENAELKEKLVKVAQSGAKAEPGRRELKAQLQECREVVEFYSSWVNLDNFVFLSIDEDGDGARANIDGEVNQKARALKQKMGWE